MVARGNSVAKVSADETTGPSAALPRSLKVSVTAATEARPAGVQNDGYWGIPVRPQTTYSGSFYAKTDSAGVPVTVSLVNDQTGAVAASATVTGSPASGSSTPLRSRPAMFRSRRTTT
jgi:alpha-N-arabinofuranosidase